MSGLATGTPSGQVAHHAVPGKAPGTLPISYACVPMTSLLFLEPGLLAAGQGPRLHIYNVAATATTAKRLLASIAINSFERIHGIIAKPARPEEATASHELLFWGGKRVTLLELDRISLRVGRISSWTAPDWILAACWLNTTSILLVTSHNVVLHYSFQDGIASPILLDKACSTEPPLLLWSACFSKTAYTDPAQVCVAVGTIMNEVLIWRPSFTSPTRIERRLIGHTGSVFFVKFSDSDDERGEYSLASGSDDRDVRLWRWARGSEQESTQCTTYRGHTHRPWRATFVQSLNMLVTVGEDLQCLLWSTKAGPTTPSEEYIKPFAVHKGHNGKNIWSVAACPKSAIIATGGSDGGIRLWPLSGSPSFESVFQITGKEQIVACHTAFEGLVVVLRNGSVLLNKYSAPASSFDLLYQLSPTNSAAQVSLASGDGALWLCTRAGHLHVVALSDEAKIGKLSTQSSPLVIAVSASSCNTTTCAVYDRATRRVLIYEAGQLDYVIEQKAQTQPLPTDRTPKFAAWLDGNIIVLADSIATVWILRYDSCTGCCEVIHFERLQHRGIFALTCDIRMHILWIGQQDAARAYRLVPHGLELIDEKCLNEGAVRQIILHTSGRQITFLACDNTSGRLISENGSILQIVKPPGASAQVLQYRRLQNGIHRYYSHSTKNVYLSELVNGPPAVLQDGLHGREIWSIDLYRFQRSQRVLCVTSAEDTDIKVSLISCAHAASGTRELFLHPKHRHPEHDGTLQNVCWTFSSMVDLDSESVLLFASAAKERILALRVTLSASDDVQVVKLAEVSAYKAIGEGQEESRIICLDALPAKTGDTLLLVGCSDGSLKLLTFSESTRTFVYRSSTTWHNRCILSVKLLSERWAISGATDGSIALWDFSSSFSSPCQYIRGLHQSGVNCLDASLHKGEIRVVTGGDDNAIAYVVFQARTDSQAPKVIKHSHAHSSSLKGIAFVDHERFVTTSTDQRLTWWTVVRSDSDTARLQRTGSRVTSVADPADLAILPADLASDTPALVAVSGIGVEVVADVNEGHVVAREIQV